MEKKKIAVSDLFVETYYGFNVTDQAENVRMLSMRERLLLLLLAVDRHSDEDPVVVGNIRTFSKEITWLRDVQDDRMTEFGPHAFDAEASGAIQGLIAETGDRYIDTDNIVDARGRKLKGPLTRQQVREEKIKRITKK